MAIKAMTCVHCGHSPDWHAGGTMDEATGRHVNCCSLCSEMRLKFPATKADCPGFAHTKAEAIKLGHFKVMRASRKKPDQTWRKQSRISG